jgi:hypothetical protein
VKKSIVAWCKQAREFQRVSGQTESLKRNYPSRLKGTIKKRISGPKALINRLFCTTRLMPFVQSIFLRPQPTSRCRRQNPKNIFAIREWKCTQSGSKTRDHPIYGPPHRRTSGNTRVCRSERLPTRLRRPGAHAAPHHTSAASGRRATTECAECAHFSNLSRPVGAHTPGPPPPTGQPAARRVSRGTRPISSGSCSRHLTNC